MRKPALAVLVCLLAGPLSQADEAGQNPEDAGAASSTWPPALLRGPLALRQAPPGLDAAQRQLFARGRSLFDQVWVAAPSVDPELDGLGPLFNQASCAACHLRNGRGAAPAGPNDHNHGLLLRLSVAADLSGAPTLPHPLLGDQLQDRAILGAREEARPRLTWIEHDELLGDGTVVPLRRPDIGFDRLLPEGPELMISARIAPQLIGLGLLDAVPEAALEELAATPRPDGISGRVNRLDSGPEAGSLGRFGWKANVGSLRVQTAAAAHGDMGLTSLLFPRESCADASVHCLGDAAELDLSEAQLDALVFYQAMLRVPPRRDAEDPTVMAGALLFQDAGCAHCHLPKLPNGPLAPLAPFTAGELEAYTDLLLHDMGPGLADGRPDHGADGQEWRTPPLWGVGLLPAVNEHQYLLHDGRARGVLEAILWHGGEAEAVRERVRLLPADAREALVAFVNSL